MVKPRGQAEVFAWAASLVNLERKTGTSRDYKLDRMRALAARLGNPQDRIPCIHLAGSKGKGSTATYIACSLEALGLRVGLFRSPHVLDWRERVCMPSSWFPDHAYVEAAHRIIDLLEECAADPAWDLGQATTFEVLTLLAFLVFEHEKVEVAVYETGLGGRLDATNLVMPLVSVITHLELEHTDILGPTLTHIATEKAGIIKEGIPVVSAPQKPEALEVLRSVAATRHAELTICEDPEVPAGPLATYGGVVLGMMGPHQAANAALARQALELCREGLPGSPSSRDILSATERGFALASMPGRASLMARGRQWVLCDGAHTPDSTEAVLRLFFSLLDLDIDQKGPLSLLFAVVEGKQEEAMAALLGSVFDHVVVTRPGTWKASDPERSFRILGAHCRGTIDLVPDEAAALEAALAHDGPVLVCGSFHLLGEIMPRLAASGYREIKASGAAEFFRCP